MGVYNTSWGLKVDWRPSTSKKTNFIYPTKNTPSAFDKKRDFVAHPTASVPTPTASPWTTSIPARDCTMPHALLQRILSKSLVLAIFVDHQQLLLGTVQIDSQP